MPDGEDDNVVNLHLSQNGQDGEVRGQNGSKYQNEKKRKTPDEGFSDQEENSSSERDIGKSKSRKKKKSLKGHKRSMRKRSSYSSTSSSSSSSTSSTGSESSSDDNEERSKPKS